jgi:hypothetical protein
LAVLTDFEEMLVYVVGSKPHPEEAGVGLWKTWRFQQYPLVAQEIWDLLARPCVAAAASPSPGGRMSYAERVRQRTL